MKCAMDLMAISQAVAKRNEELALAKALKEKEERQRYTISICKEMGTQLEEMALNGKTPKLVFECDNSGYRLCDGTRYADGRMGQAIYGQKLDLETLQEWFADYCFKVTFSKMTWWCYGCGSFGGYRVEIFPNPQCA